MRARLLLFALPTLFVCSIARGQSDATGCSASDPDVRIAACSDLMVSGLGPLQIAMALSNRSLAFGAKGDYRHANEDLDRAISLAPEIVFLFNNRCYFLAAGDRAEQALPDCDHALASEPTNQQFLDSRGYVYFRLGRYRDAIGDLDRAIASDPSSPSALYLRGLARLKIGDPSGRSDLEQATKLDGDVSQKMSKLGITAETLTAETSVEH